MIKTYKNYVINANIVENYNSLNENQISFEISKDGKTIDNGRLMTKATLTEFVENNIETAIDRLALKEQQESGENWLTNFFTEYNKLQESKPDFLDLDKDGDKEEPMKQAAKDAEDDEETVDETTTTASVNHAGATGAWTKSPFALGGDLFRKPKTNESTDRDRYEEVVTIQGSGAEEILDIIDKEGEDAAIEYLRDYHSVGEHPGKDDLDTDSDEMVVWGGDDGYVLVYNPAEEFVSLVYKLDKEEISESSQTFYDTIVNTPKKQNAATNSKHVSQSLDNAKAYGSFPEGGENPDDVKKYKDSDKRKDGVFRNRGENMADVALAAAYDPMTGEFDEKYLDRVEKQAKGPDGEGFDLMPYANDRLKSFDPSVQDFWTGTKQNVDSVNGGLDFKYKEIKRESIDFNIRGNETIYTKKPINCSEDIDATIGNRFKIDGNTYKISDGINETYFKWIGDVDGHSVIVNHLNEDGLKGELNRMDDLTKFKSKATSVNENVNMFREMMDNVRNGDMRFSLRDGIEERIMTVNECLGRFGESDVSKLKKLSRHESCTVYENNKPFLVRRIY